MNKVGIETDRITEPENTIVKIDDVDYKDIIGHMRGDQDFNGPLTTRKCTNTFFLIFFILCNCGLIACTVYIFLKGNPKSLTKGYDLRGNVCGLNELSSKRFMLFPNQTTLDWSLCVEACPYYYYKNYYCLYDGNNTEKYYPEWGCWDAYSTTAIGFYCVPTSKEPRKEVLSFLAESMQVLKQSSGDLLLVWDLILIGSIFSTLTGFFLLFLFRKAKVIKWIVIGSIGFLAVVMAFFVFLLVYASQRSFDLICGNYGPAMPEYCDHSSEYFYIGISYAVGVLGAIYIYKVIGKYKDFGIGIEMIELTCKPLHVIRELLLFPFIQIFIGTAVLLLLLMLVLWTMSSASVQEIQSENIPGGKAYIIAFTVLEKYILIFNTLMALWWINFVVDLGDFVLAGGVATWYFSRQKDVLYVNSYIGPTAKRIQKVLTLPHWLNCIRLLN